MADPNRLSRLTLGTSSSQEESLLVRVLCPQRAFLANLISHSTRKKIQAQIDGNAANFTVALFTLISLFANDTDTIIYNGYSDFGGLGVTLKLCFAVFLIDILARCSLEAKYVFSFYFWLDLISTVSLGVELVVESVSYEDLLLARTVRATRAGAKLPRLIRLLKLVRMLRVLKLWQTLTRRIRGEYQSVSHVAYGEENADASEEDDSPYAITENLAVIISRKVVVSVLVVIFLFNFIEPIRHDRGPELGLGMLHELGLKGLKIDEVTQAFERMYKSEILEVKIHIAGRSEPDIILMNDSEKARSSLLNNLYSTLCSSAMDDDEDNEVAFHTSDNLVFDYKVNCEASLYAKLDSSASLVEEAYVGIFQTSLMVLFVLGWAFSLQHDIQFYLVSPLMLLPYGGDKRRSTYGVIPDLATKDEERELASSQPPAQPDKNTATIGPAALARAATKRRLRGSVMASSPTVLEFNSSSHMVMAISCLKNIRGSFVTDPDLQKALDTVIGMLVHKTDWNDSIYNPIISNVVDRVDFRMCSREVKRWVYSELLNVSSSTLLVLNEAACKKLGVDMISDVQHHQTKRQSSAAGDFNFKLAAVSKEGTKYNELFSNIIDELDKQSRKLEAKSFDIFELQRLTDNRPLTWVYYAVHVKHDMFSSFSLNEAKMMSYLAIVESGAWCSNPLHNNTQAADILRTIHWYLTQSRIEDRITKLEALAIFFACTVINYQHTGRSNNFEVETQSGLAVCFGDESVLERYSLAAAFGVLNHHLANFLEKLEPVEWKTFRKLVAKVVISRDAALHENMVEKIKVTAKPFDPKQKIVLPADEQREVLLVMMLKASVFDIFTKDKNEHLQWTERMFTEFFEMGDAEQNHNIPISPFCNREMTNVGHATVAMFEFVVLPFFNCFTQILPLEQRQGIRNALDANYMMWKKRKNKEQASTKKKLPGVIGLFNRRLSGNSFKSPQGSKVLPDTSTKEAPASIGGDASLGKSKVDDANEEELIEQFRSSTRYSARRTQSLVNLNIPEDQIKEIEQLQNNLVDARPFNLQHQASSVAILRAQKIDQVLDKAVRQGTKKFK